MKKGRRIVACLCAVLLGSAILTVQGADAHGRGSKRTYKKKDVGRDTARIDEK